MKRLFRKLTRWTYREPVFMNISNQSQFVKLQEEVDELRKDPDDPSEYADVLMCLLILADRNEISYRQLKRTFRKKLKINIKRRWVKDENGVNKHIPLIKKHDFL